jgi:hypothetical protein
MAASASRPTGDPDLPDEPDAAAGFIDLPPGHSASDDADHIPWRDHYRQLSPSTRPNLAATTRHLVGHPCTGSSGTTP